MEVESILRSKKFKHRMTRKDPLVDLILLIMQPYERYNWNLNLLAFNMNDEKILVRILRNSLQNFATRFA